ncbi:glycosyltransferase family 2 protein [Halomonas cupida]|uniref:glycosyltransferase family 2 protein n=1 Tax=Halomonas cupida TaxID=44933 RepID=UPI003EF1656C
MNQKVPLVSVVIPTYNRSSAVVRAVRSVLAQPYPSLECIVVDDASSDDTRDVVRALALEDSRLTLLPLHENVGQGAARNAGVEVAEGEFVCFLDSDDELLPGAVQNRVDVYMKAPTFDGIAFGGNIVAGKTEVILPADLTKGQGITLEDYMQDRGWLHTNAFMMRRALFRQLGGFREDLRQKQDIEFFIRALCRMDAKYCGAPCSRMHDEGDVRARNHHERIARQGYLFIDAVRTNPEVVERVPPPLLEGLVQRGVSTYMNALYRTGHYSRFRRVFRSAWRQGDVHPSSRWLKRYALSWLWSLPKIFK